VRAGFYLPKKIVQECIPFYQWFRYVCCCIRPGASVFKPSGTLDLWSQSGRPFGAVPRHRNGVCARLPEFVTLDYVWFMWFICIRRMRPFFSFFRIGAMVADCHGAVCCRPIAPSPPV